MAFHANSQPNNQAFFCIVCILIPNFNLQPKSEKKIKNIYNKIHHQLEKLKYNNTSYQHLKLLNCVCLCLYCLVDVFVTRSFLKSTCYVFTLYSVELFYHCRAIIIDKHKISVNFCITK